MFDKPTKKFFKIFKKILKNRGKMIEYFCNKKYSYRGIIYASKL